MIRNQILHDLLAERVARRKVNKTAAMKSIAADMGISLRAAWRWLDGSRGMEGPSIKFARILLQLETTGSVASSDLQNVLSESK